MVTKPKNARKFIKVQTLLLHRASRRITSIINQQLHLYKLHITTLKINRTCFDLFLDHHQGCECHNITLARRNIAT